MRSFAFGVESAKKIADILRQQENDYFHSIASEMEKIIEKAGEGGMFIFTGQRLFQERKGWREEEEQRFIRLVETWQKSLTWKEGRRKYVWEMLALDFQRKPSSLKSKYAQLRRRGKIG